ncbi:bifunctional phosphatase PAP2/diacylglycerol kinase family protein [Streptomyces gobiensis]|uniref:bifunctional phosphatase PAP2/diacylglycerol kinase family protein n=1 Tax=Streptomyces gobiensis TaxID=2875706 RepID=UPI001E2E03A2|nr:bifunctional phosphatase PAP2/diacylglycerol kinase family protein [Streptomyces gobiensis]UGY95279.1 phosphatase PAP2 family protein [Streptomyces gobiensis]
MVARRAWPGAEPVLPRLSRSANHGLLWFATAAAIAASGLGGRSRVGRAALRGTASLALASLTVNTLGKRSVRRVRPLLDAVPVIRQLHRQPVSTSFPSGHSASAAAFATGVALESRGWGVAVAPVAASVAFSRVYVGVHYPSDVLAGLALGVGAAFAVRGLFPGPEPVRPPASAPALPEGRGLVVVVNTGAGPAPPAVEQITALLPGAELRLYHSRQGDGQLAGTLESAALRAVELGGALGVFGGDGTVSAAARTAARHRLPLAVLPGGRRNHFASDLGITTPAAACTAVTSGEAVAVDLAHFGTDGSFINTFALGVYPDLLRTRDRWAPYIGEWSAGVLAAARALRRGRTVEVSVNGVHRHLRLLFAGNCRYKGLGLTPRRRSNLADGLLDIRVVQSGRSPVWAHARLRKLQIDWIEPGTRLAYDGEVMDAPGELLLTKTDHALTVYRPLTT